MSKTTINITSAGDKALPRSPSIQSLAFKKKYNLKGEI